MSHTEHRPPLVGRETELAFLLQRLARAGQGAGSVTLVAGEPGIGKTRLVAELSAAARDDGWQVLSGRAYDTAGLPPYLPFSEALSGYLRTAPPEVLRAQLGAGAAEVALLLPELSLRLPDLEPSLALPAEQMRYRLIEAVSAFLLDVARAPDHPGLLLSLDDLHWADAPTLLLLLHLTRRLAEAPLIVVGTYRTVELDRTHPLAAVLADMRREGLGERLLLTPLTAAAAIPFIAQIASATPAPPVVAALHDETGGNPFFLGELVTELLAEGRDLTDSRALVAQWSIPEGVREVIGRRLSRLSGEANRVLQAAAVLGDGVEFTILEAVTELSFDVLTEALEAALIAGFLREDGTAYHFGHALMRQTVAAELSLPRRQRLHLRAADAIERVHARNLEPHLGVLASHLRLAGAAAEPDRTLTYAVRAAKRAERVFAWEEARTHWQTALEISEELGQPVAGQRYDLLVAFGLAQRRAGDAQAAIATFRRALDLARAAGDPEGLARAALDLEDARWEAGLPTVRARAALEEADRILDSGDSRDSGLRARVIARLAFLAAEASHEVPEGGAVVSAAVICAAVEHIPRRLVDAVAMARRTGDLFALATALHAQLESPEPEGWTAQDQLAIATELLAVAHQLGSGELASRGHHHRIGSLLQLGDVAAVDREIADQARMVAELRAPWHAAFTGLYRATRALLVGHFTEAERLSMQAQVDGQQLQSRIIEGQAASQLRMVRHLQGKPTGVDMPVAADRESLTLIHTLHPDARATADRLMASGGVPFLTAGGLAVLCRLAEWRAVRGDVGQARVLYELLRPSAGLYATFGSAVCIGAVSQYLGLLATTLSCWDEAEAHFEQALAMNARIGAQPFVARTARGYAEMLLLRRRRGDASRARASLHQAAAISEALGMAPDLARVRALLTDPVVATASSATVPHADGLSVREVEVLRLMAGGKSNAEIAESLVISIHTVIRHANHIFAKLGVTNRTEAAAYAHRHGLL